MINDMNQDEISTTDKKINRQVFASKMRQSSGVGSINHYLSG